MHVEMTFRNHQDYNWGHLERDNALRHRKCYLYTHAVHKLVGDEIYSFISYDNMTLKKSWHVITSL